MKRLIIAILLAILCIGLVACKEESVTTTEETLENNQLNIYYVNRDKTKLIDATYDFTDVTDIDLTVDEIMNAFMEETTSAKREPAIPLDMKYMYKELKIDDNEVVLNFNMNYDTVSKKDEVLAKAAIVSALTQIEGVEKVTFAFNDIYNNTDIAIIEESYEKDSFLFSNNGDGSQSGEITIYFVNEDGTALKEYSKAVSIDNDVSIEQVVVESIIKGPLRDGYKASVPSDVKLNKISVKDGVCYIDLSQEFNEGVTDIRSDLTIYSVVNSLIELPSVNKVQFTIDGQKQEVYRETVAFDGFFERKLDLVENSDYFVEPPTTDTSTDTDTSNTGTTEPSKGVNTKTE